MKNSLILLNGIFGLLVSSGCGQPSYNLHNKVAPGEIFRSQETFQIEEGRLVVSVSGESIEGHAEMTMTLTTEIDILEAKKGIPTRLKLSLMESELQMRRTIPGQPAEEMSEPNSLGGRSLLFERDENAWSKRLVGGKPTEPQRIEMETYDDPWPEDWVPDRKVKLGESWAVTGDKLRKLFGFAPEGFTGKIQVHFKEVVEYNGEQCALLSLQVDASGSVPASDAQEMKASLSGEGHIYRSLTTKTNVYSKISGDTTWKITGQEAGETLRITVTGPFFMEAIVSKD